MSVAIKGIGQFPIGSLRDNKTDNPDSRTDGQRQVGACASFGRQNRRCDRQHRFHAESYDVLNLLTARPGPDDLKAAPHYLYGHVSPAHRLFDRHAGSPMPKSVLAGQNYLKRLVIFVGGTGLYFRVRCSAGYRQCLIFRQISARIGASRMRSMGAEELHAILAGKDPCRRVDACARLIARGSSGRSKCSMRRVVQSSNGRRRPADR